MLVVACLYTTNRSLNPSRCHTHGAPHQTWALLFFTGIGAASLIWLYDVLAARTRRARVAAALLPLSEAPPSEKLQSAAEPSADEAQPKDAPAPAGKDVSPSGNGSSGGVEGAIAGRGGPNHTRLRAKQAMFKAGPQEGLRAELSLLGESE
jgi:hypothetical protein